MVFTGSRVDNHPKHLLSALVFLLFPEALLEDYLVSYVPAPARSIWDVFLLSELLAFGSFAFAYLLALGRGKISKA